MNVPFEEDEESTYNPAFVAKIRKSEEQVKAGKVNRVEKADLQSFLGIE